MPQGSSPKPSGGMTERCRPASRSASPQADTPLTRERSTRQERLDRDGGFADGAANLPLFHPNSWKSVKRVRVTGAWSHEDAPEGPSHDLDATAIDSQTMR